MSKQAYLSHECSSIKILMNVVGKQAGLVETPNKRMTSIKSLIPINQDAYFNSLRIY